MFLKSLEVRGFKSFADKTELEFKKHRHGKVFVKTVDKLKRGRVRVTVIEKVEEFKI